MLKAWRNKNVLSFDFKFSDSYIIEFPVETLNLTETETDTHAFETETFRFYPETSNIRDETCINLVLLLMKQFMSSYLLVEVLKL